MSPHLSVILDITGSVAAAWVLLLTTLAVRRLRGLRQLLEDWHGEPSRPGVPARPGVMVRLAAIECELYPNGGGSLRDAVGRIEHQLGELAGTTSAAVPPHHLDHPESHP